MKTVLKTAAGVSVLGLVIFWCENIVGENQQEPEQLNDIEKRLEKKKEIYYFGTKGEEMKHKGKILYALFGVAVITLVFVGNVILG